MGLVAVCVGKRVVTIRNCSFTRAMRNLSNPTPSVLGFCRLRHAAAGSSISRCGDRALMLLVLLSAAGGKRLRKSC